MRMGHLGRLEFYQPMLSGNLKGPKNKYNKMNMESVTLELVF